MIKRYIWLVLLCGCVAAEDQSCKAPETTTATSTRLLDSGGYGIAENVVMLTNAGHRFLLVKHSNGISVCEVTDASLIER